MIRESQLTAVTADDEPLARVALRRALESVGGVEIVAEAAGGSEAVAAIRQHRPDVVFLDIEMPEMHGFEVVQALEDVRPIAVIFVTAHDEHALQAFEVRAIDYLVKPFSDARLSEALSRVRETRDRHDRRQLADAVKQLLERRERTSGNGGSASGTPAEPITRFMIETDKGKAFVEAEAVEWIEASGNYVLLHVGDEEHRVRVAISTLEERLDPREFVRVHRSAIVNLGRLREVQSWFSGDYIALMDSGAQVRVSRNFKDELLKRAR